MTALASVMPREEEPPTAVQPWTRNISSPWHPSQGLQGEHLCVWASHGKYLKQATGQWTWQRPALFCTTEDLLTPSFVYPFLIPMLEKAGAVVWTPRERDRQTCMMVAEAPTSETNQAYFWHFTVPTPGNYAVYASYPSTPTAVPDAVYSIRHGGERTRIAVNQRMGGDAWTYLGTYFFDGTARIDLSKDTRYRGQVAAGRIRIGGGTSNESGIPHYLEAARYYTARDGAPDSLYNTENGQDDYKDDLRCRSNMLNWLREERGVPFTLSLAVHTDAGYRTDSIPYASLAICTTQDADGAEYYPDSLPRKTSYDYCETLLNTIDRDLADLHWQQRELRDRNYAETRMPHIPSAIIEMLSHQNFLDARLAHDPVFKFRMARAIYKATLRYIAKLKGIREPVIQPLPVKNFVAMADPERTEASLSWEETTDSLEESAEPTHYIIYTRVDDSDYDNGQITHRKHFRQHLLPGHRYSFRVTAVNAGGESFPSNELCVYLPICNSYRDMGNTLLVDAFTRQSGPAYIHTADSIGFLLNEDIGVPYGTTLEYCGAQIDFNPAHIGREGPGALGYSSEELAGKPVVGNHFNIASTRAQQLLVTDSLQIISSASMGAINEDFNFPTRRMIHNLATPHIYWLAGQQRRAPQNMADYPVWPEKARPYIEECIKKGTLLTVEGTFVSPNKLSSEERIWWEKLF